MLITPELENYLKKIRAALDKHAINISSDTKEINEYAEILRKWTPGNYIAGDVRIYNGIPYKCIQTHDSTGNETWNPSVASLWMQYHGTSIETARPWVAPTMAEDIYKTDEYMIWTDGFIYKCLSNTNFSPTDYPTAWEKIE